MKIIYEYYKIPCMLVYLKKTKCKQVFGNFAIPF